VTREVNVDESLLHERLRTMDAGDTPALDDLAALLLAQHRGAGGAAARLAAEAPEPVRAQARALVARLEECVALQAAERVAGAPSPSDAAWWSDIAVSAALTLRRHVAERLAPALKNRAFMPEPAMDLPGVPDEIDPPHRVCDVVYFAIRRLEGPAADARQRALEWRRFIRTPLEERDRIITAFVDSAAWERVIDDMP